MAAGWPGWFIMAGLFYERPGDFSHDDSGQSGWYRLSEIIWVAGLVPGSRDDPGRPGGRDDSKWPG